MKKKKISIVTPTYNEELNIDEFYERLISVINLHSSTYDFEVIVIDNCSKDNTIVKLKKLAIKDSRLKIIVNTRNFGHIRSPYYGILNSFADATVYLASDLQDPPELISQFLSAWEGGSKLVMGIKSKTKNTTLFDWIRGYYYRFLDKISQMPVIMDSTGFGLYDRVVVDHLRQIYDPYPFLRGLVAELGYSVACIPFTQEKRKRGISKNNFYSLYDIAWLGFIAHSKVPARLASFAGFIIGGISLIIGLVFLILKIVFWSQFPLGIAPMIIGLFLLFGIQFVFMGIIGEYVSAILVYVQKRPVVVEKERINFCELLNDESESN